MLVGFYTLHEDIDVARVALLIGAHSRVTSHLRKFPGVR
jgi:hypothetical protein